MLYRDEGNLNTRGKALKKGRLRFFVIREVREFAKFSRELGSLMMAGVLEAELVDPK
jgi:hypothetical protein